MALIEQLKERRASLRRELDNIVNAPGVKTRGMTLAEASVFDAKAAEVGALDERIADLTEQAERENEAAASRRMLGSGITVRGREVYGPTESNSYFLDLANSRRGDMGAMERLRTNNDLVAREHRAGDMSTSTNAGGQFAPPAWLVEDFVALARPHRVTADVIHHENLPNGVSSVNLPKVASGASVAVQTSQNTAVSDTAMTTTSVSSSITTIAGKQIVSLQLIEQSGIPFDRVILGDLAADYAKQLDVQVISGTGANGELRGLLNGAGVGSTTFTTTQPSFTSSTAANSWYNKYLAAVAGIANNRYAPATAVLMTPTRWAWILQAIDGQQRPMVVPTANFNAPGVSTEIVAEGSAGTLGGLPVYLDPNLPTTAGAGTNEDRTIILRADDAWLWESGGGIPKLEAFEATYADQLSVLFRAVGYSALIPDRYGASVNYMSGTGCVSPTL